MKIYFGSNIIDGLSRLSRLVEKPTGNNVAIVITLVFGINFVYRVIAVPLIQNNKYQDFSAYYVAAKTLLKGELIYNYELTSGSKQYVHDQCDFSEIYYQNIKSTHIFDFRYPPFSAVLFIPFSIFTYSVAKIIWLSLMVVALIVTIIMIIKLEIPNEYRNSFLIILTGISIFNPVEQSLGLGQIMIPLLLINLICIHFAIKGNDLMSGLFLALGIHIKIMPVILLIYFLARKRWYICFYTIAFGVIMLIIGLLATSIHTHYYYVTKIVPYLTNMIDWPSSQSFTAFMLRISWLIPNISELTLFKISRTIIAIMLIIIFLYFSIKSKPDKLEMAEEFSFMLMVILFVSSLTFQHYYVMVIPALWLFRPRTTDGWLYIIPYACSFALMAFEFGYLNETIRHGIFSLWISTKFYGLVILMVLAIWRIHTHREMIMETKGYEDTF